MAQAILQEKHFELRKKLKRREKRHINPYKQAHTRSSERTYRHTKSNLRIQYNEGVFTE